MLNISPKIKIISFLLLLAFPFSTFGVMASPMTAAIGISNISDLGTVGKYNKQEITFRVATSATNPQMPFDAAPPTGVEAGIGVSVDAVFTSPTGKKWNQPGFYYPTFTREIKEGSEWIYPTGKAVWKVRFAPNEIGTWSYFIKAQDSTGTTQSTTRSFNVIASTNHGFIKVSKKDPRYFEFSDGTYFPAMGVNAAYNEVQWTNPTANKTYFKKMSGNGIQVLRTWLSTWAIFGSSWNPWYSIRNDYDYYLPRAGLYVNSAFSTPLRLVYAEDAGNRNTDWFDACRFIGGFQATPTVKSNTSYHIKIKYKARGISGPRNNTYPGYGFVAKVQNPNIGDWHRNCYDSGDQNGVKVTGYGHDSADWAYIEGNWDSGNRNFLPIFYLALDNAKNIGAVANGQPWNTHPEVDIDNVFIGENLGNGKYGPNIVTKPSMNHLTYFMERNAYAFDKTLDVAKQSGVYLKLVVMEKNELIENETGYNGKRVFFDNNNFYGNYRKVTSVRWYQQAWYRYLQARWGYSTNIFSFEAVNEAAPAYTNHYGQVDEMAKDLHCRVFGVSVGRQDGQKCNLKHPNAHMVSTSFWAGFEGDFFASSKYPNVDYADIHQYIPKDTDLVHFQDTALSTYDVGKTTGALESGSGKPVIRGETGLIYQESNTDSMADLSADTQGIWLHNLVWGGINPTGLIENYWYARGQIYNDNIDLRYHFKRYYTFIKDVPLNNGRYKDASATTSAPKLRAWGQKDLTNQKAHLWIANTDHVWTNTGTITPITGTVSIAGLKANTNYDVEWWNTYSGLVTSTQIIKTNSNGRLILPISNLTTDVAVKIKIH